MIDERTEQLITRRLDGQIREDESLELDKLLIRSPDARQACEESQHIDELAAQTLRSLFQDPPARESSAEPADGSRGRNWHRLAQYGLGAAAAVLLMIAAAPLLPNGATDRHSGGTAVIPPAVTPPIGESFSPAPAVLVSDENAEPDEIFGVIAGPRQYREAINRDVIGVLDPETQSVYLLELQTARNTVRSVRANY